MTARRPILTREGKERLLRELADLRERRRPELLRRLREAIEAAHGDIAHSSEYAEAKREQAFVEGRIAELEHLLAEAEVIEAPPTAGLAGPGSTVSVRQDGLVERYTLVGPAEADPARGRISIESPVGRALLGHRQGEVVEAETPAGRLRLEIIAVE